MQHRIRLARTPPLLSERYFPAKIGWQYERVVAMATSSDYRIFNPAASCTVASMPGIHWQIPVLTSACYLKLSGVKAAQTKAAHGGAAFAYGKRYCPAASCLENGIEPASQLGLAERFVHRASNSARNDRL